MVSKKEKDELYESLYDLSQAGEPVKETQEVVADSGVTEVAVEQTEEPAKETAEETSEEVKTEEPAQVVDGGETEVLQEKTKEDRLVPLSEVKKEREKRQRLKAELTAKEEQLRKERDEALDLLYQYTKKDEGDLDYEGRLLNLEDENKRLREKIQSVDRVVATKQQQDEYDKVMQQVSDVNSKLTDEGYVGFNKYYHLVINEIGSLPEEERREALHSPEKWEEIYKTTVFPDLAETIGRVTKEKKFAEKDALKSQVQMLGEKKSESQITKSDAWGYDDYMAARMKGK